MIIARKWGGGNSPWYIRIQSWGPCGTSDFIFWSPNIYSRSSEYMTLLMRFIFSHIILGTSAHISYKCLRRESIFVWLTKQPIYFFQKLTLNIYDYRIHEYLWRLSRTLPEYFLTDWEVFKYFVREAHLYWNKSIIKLILFMVSSHNHRHRTS